MDLQNIHVSLFYINTCIMTTKLTLTIDDNAIKAAKAYAQSKGKSLSHLVENYLKSLTSNQPDNQKVSSTVLKWKGSINLSEDFDYKKALSKTINKKHKRA